MIVQANGVHTLVVRDSGNTKLGRSGATYRSQESCPIWCALYSAGCYARGRIFGIARRSGTVDDGTYTAVRDLAALPADRIIRFNVSGDYLGPDGRPDLAYIDATNVASHGRARGSVISYSHAWQVLEPAMFAYQVNASCDSAEDIARARDAGWQTVAVVPAEDIGRAAGRGIVPCVAQVRPGATCSSCRLCARPRAGTVGFAAHGSGRAQALRAIARAGRPAPYTVLGTYDPARPPGDILIVPAEYGRATIGPDGTVRPELRPE